jgi:hypothetical protein
VLLALALWAAFVAGYGYFMRFLRDTGRGSAATMARRSPSESRLTASSGRSSSVQPR